MSILQVCTRYQEFKDPSPAPAAMDDHQPIRLELPTEALDALPHGPIRQRWTPNR